MPVGLLTPGVEIVRLPSREPAGASRLVHAAIVNLAEEPCQAVSGDFGVSWQTTGVDGRSGADDISKRRACRTASRFEDLYLRCAGD